MGATRAFVTVKDGTIYINNWQLAREFLLSTGKQVEKCAQFDLTVKDICLYEAEFFGEKKDAECEVEAENGETKNGDEYSNDCEKVCGEESEKYGETKRNTEVDEKSAEDEESDKNDKQGARHAEMVDCQAVLEKMRERMAADKEDFDMRAKADREAEKEKLAEHSAKLLRIIGNVDLYTETHEKIKEDSEKDTLTDSGKYGETKYDPEQDKRENEGGYTVDPRYWRPAPSWTTVTMYKKDKTGKDDHSHDHYQDKKDPEWQAVKADKKKDKKAKKKQENPLVP